MRILVVMSSLVSLLLGGAVPARAADPILACQRALLAGSQKLAHATLAATESCEARKRSAQLPVDIDCASEAKTVAARTKAGAALMQQVAKRCGGPDHACGTGDDLAPGALGWPGTCPSFEGAACAAPIGDCRGMTSCEICVDGAATDRARALLFDSLLPSNPKLQKALRKCQSAIGKEGAKLFDADWKALARCWDARLSGKHANPCPDPGDGKARTAIDAATAAAHAKICKACGGHDGTCDGVDDIAVATIGVAPTCPNVGTCGGPIATVGELAGCLACTSAARAACTAALAAPSVAPYPPACAVPQPTSTTTPGPLPTATPSPASTPVTVGCAVAAPGSVETSVTITLDSASAVGAASLVLDYPPDRVRLPSIGGDADVRARVTDLTGSKLFDKGEPNNQDSNSDNEADRLLLTLVATSGVTGAILRIDFDRCDGASPTAAGDYTCIVVAGSAVAPDGVTPIPGTACHVTLSP